MSLLTAGYFPTTFFPESFFIDDYWQNRGDIVISAFMEYIRFDSLITTTLSFDSLITTMISDNSKLGD